MTSKKSFCIIFLHLDKEVVLRKFRAARNFYLICFFLLLLLFSPLTSWAALHDFATQTKAYSTHNLNSSEMCTACHGGDRNVYTKGIHDYMISSAYTGTTLTAAGWCLICHDIHEAEQRNLLPEQTISDFCFLCHDGTSANVDGDIDADAYNPTLGYYTANNIIYGLVTTSLGPISRHRVNSNNTKYFETGATSTIPLGSPPLDTPLKCTTCHSPHGTSTKIVDIFNSKSAVPDSPDWTSGVSYGQYDQNMLLKRYINGNTATTYSGGWCATCHWKAADMISSAPDHPVDTSTPYNWATGSSLNPVSDPRYTYDANYDVYFFNHAYNATSGAPAPICMNCHDDRMDVEELPYTTTYTYSDNFPHEVNNPRMTVETGDDLCLNCHITTELP